VYCPAGADTLAVCVRELQVTVSQLVMTSAPSACCLRTRAAASATTTATARPRAFRSPVMKLLAKVGHAWSHTKSSWWQVVPELTCSMPATMGHCLVCGTGSHYTLATATVLSDSYILLPGARFQSSIHAYLPQPPPPPPPPHPTPPPHACNAARCMPESSLALLLRLPGCLVHSADNT
jgi:hypothetical protein